MAKILLIETSTEVCSAAISVDGRVVAISENPSAQSHAALLTLQIRECSETSGIRLEHLDAVAVSRGPGAYTALRVGASVAKGICYALEKPLIAVDTLQSLAFASREISADWTLKRDNQQHPPSIFVPMLDARRQEVWLAVYDADLRTIAAAQPLILENNMFYKYIENIIDILKIGGVILAGNGMKKIRSGDFWEKVIFSEVVSCSSRHLAALAEQGFQMSYFQDIAYFEPFYMKAPNITTPSQPPF